MANYNTSTKLANVGDYLSPIVLLERLDMSSKNVIDHKLLSYTSNDKLISPKSATSAVILASNDHSFTEKQHKLQVGAKVLQDSTNIVQGSRLTPRRHRRLTVKRKTSESPPSMPSKRQVSLLHYYRSPSAKDNDDQITDENRSSPPSSPNNDDIGVNVNIFREGDETFLTQSQSNDETVHRSSKHQKGRSISKSLWPIHYASDKKFPEYNSSKQIRKSSGYTNISTSEHQRPNHKSTSRSHDNKEQLIIDAGQKSIGARICLECGMLYSANCNEDVLLHYKIHNHMMLSLRFSGWKKERVVREFVDGRVILILPEDPVYALKKVESIKRVMDEKLGFHDKAQPDCLTMQVYMFVSDCKVVSCLICEAISQANKAIPSKIVEGPPMCSTITTPAICGINRIWTLKTHQRKKIATRLLECMRTTFYYGCEIPKDQIAFSDPTPEGALFAMKYSETEEFLIYK